MSTMQTASATQSASLTTMLAARKAQISSGAAIKALSGLRNGQDVDSDDDDDDEETPQQPGSASELLLGRAPNLLCSASVEERKKIIAALEAAELSAEQLKPLLRPLLLRFSDSSERCRDGAVGLFSRWQRSSEASEVSGSLPFLMPVMAERLGSEQVLEPSEEVRASLVCLMRDVLMKCRALIRPFTHEVGAIALGCSRDTHPEVIKGLCELLATIAVAILQPLVREQDKKVVKPFSTKLLEAVLPHIRHRHAAVRLSVLGALEELLLCGAGQSVETLVGWRLKNNVPIAEFYGKGERRMNYLADLSRDRSVAVRRKFVQVVARWCREMDGEDLYEQEVRIICYLAGALCDVDDETATAARLEIERLGELYLEKEAKDYKERIEYGYGDEQRETEAITLPAPKPFVCRPPLGARERMRCHFRSLIYPIMTELDLWTSGERLQSALLLEKLLVYNEGNSTEFSHQILPSLAKGMDEDVGPYANKGLPDAVGRCAMQFAQHTEPEEYLSLLISHASSDALNSLNERMQHLKLTPHLLRGMRPPAAARALVGLSPLLSDEMLVCSQHTKLRVDMRAFLAAIVATAAELGKGGVAPVPASFAPTLLYAILTHLTSAPALQPKLTTIGEGLQDIEPADDKAWASAAADAAAFCAPLSEAFGLGDTSVWEAFEPEVSAMVRAAVAAEDDHAEESRRLLEMLGGGGGGAVAVPRRAVPAPVPVEPSGRTGRAAVAAAVAGPARQVVAIAACDDFSDDDEEEVPIKAAPQPPVIASAVAPYPPDGMRKMAIADDDSDDEEGDEAAAPELEVVKPAMRKIAIDEDEEDEFEDELD